MNFLVISFLPLVYIDSYGRNLFFEVVYDRYINSKYFMPFLIPCLEFYK